MTNDQIREEVIDILEVIAPDEDLTDLDDAGELSRPAGAGQHGLSWTSSWSCASGTGSRFPEDDYTSLASMNSTVEYLEPLLKDVEKV